MAPQGSQIERIATLEGKIAELERRLIQGENRPAAPLPMRKGAVFGKLDAKLSAGSSPQAISIWAYDGSSLANTNVNLPEAYEWGLGTAAVGGDIPAGTEVFAFFMPDGRWYVLTATSWRADADDNQPAGETAHTITGGEKVDFEGHAHTGGFRSRITLPHGAIVIDDNDDIGGSGQSIIDNQTPLGIMTRTVTVGGIKKVQHCVTDEVAICIKLLATGGSISGETVVLFDDHASHNTFGLDAGQRINLKGTLAGTVEVSVAGSLFTFATDAGTNVVVDAGEQITLKGEGDIETEGDGSGNTCTIRSTQDQFAKMILSLFPGSSALAQLQRWNAATEQYDTTGPFITIYDDIGTHCVIATEICQVRKDPGSGRHQAIGGGSLIRDGKANGAITAGSSGTVDLYASDSFIGSVTAHLDWMETAGDDIADTTEVEVVWIMQPAALGGGEWKIRWAACPPATDSLTQQNQEYALLMS